MLVQYGFVRRNGETELTEISKITQEWQDRYPESFYAGFVFYQARLEEEHWYSIVEATCEATGINDAIKQLKKLPFTVSMERVSGINISPQYLRVSQSGLYMWATL
jgi:hypothetical protein